MGVAAVRRSTTRMPGALRRRHPKRNPSVRQGTLLPAQRAAGSSLAVPVRARPTPLWAADDRKGVWERLQDDRELIGLKVVLLVSLLMLTALLEWVA